MQTRKYHAFTLALLLAIAGCLIEARSQETTTLPAKPPTPHSFALSLHQPIPIDVKSPGVVWKDQTYHLIRLGRAQFHLDAESHLRGRFTGGINTFDDVTYDVHVALFNAQGQLLGTAKTICPVPRMWEGRTVTMSRTLEFDFGINRDYAHARFFTVGINNCKVLTPAEWQKQK